MIKRHILIPFLSMLTLCASAQPAALTHNASSDTPFSSLNIGVSAGSSGFGIDLAMPLSNMFRVRLGAGYIPRANVPMTFDLMSYAGENQDPNESDDQRFDKLSELMESFIGMKVDRKVKMNAKGAMADFRLLVDIFPLKNNKHWYATAGFYWGSSKVGHIENTIQEAPSLMGVIMYNQMYDYFVGEKFFDAPFYGDAWMDPIMGLEMKEKFLRYGRVGAHVGDFKSGPMQAGLPYMLEPDENGTIHADMYVNHFKPYLGIGYTATVSKDGRWNIGFDAGALFWGKPKILTHERYIFYEDGSVGYGTVTDENFSGTIGPFVDLATDVKDIKGKVGTYCSIAKAIHVFPVLNFRISYKLF